MVYRRWEDPVEETSDTDHFYIGLNFTYQDQEIEIGFKGDGEWIDLLLDDDDDARISVVNGLCTVKLTSNWGHVFYKRLANQRRDSTWE